MALTDDAKAEIREALRIIREDRFEGFARQRLNALTTPKDPPNTPPPTPPGPGDPPPPKDSPEGDPPDPPKGRKSAYWGQFFDDGDT